MQFLFGGYSFGHPGLVMEPLSLVRNPPQAAEEQETERVGGQNCTLLQTRAVASLALLGPASQGSPSPLPSPPPPRSPGSSGTHPHTCACLRPTHSQGRRRTCSCPGCSRSAAHTRRCSAWSTRPPLGSNGRRERCWHFLHSHPAFKPTPLPTKEESFLIAQQVPEGSIKTEAHLKDSWCAA